MKIKGRRKSTNIADHSTPERSAKTQIQQMHNPIYAEDRVTYESWMRRDTAAAQDLRTRSTPKENEAKIVLREMNEPRNAGIRNIFERRMKRDTAAAQDLRYQKTKVASRGKYSK